MVLGKLGEATKASGKDTEASGEATEASGKAITTERHGIEFPQSSKSVPIGFNSSQSD